MNITNEIEAASLEAEHILSMVRAVSDGIYSGRGNYQNYEGALEGIYRMLEHLTKHLNAIESKMLSFEKTINIL